jgi:4-alpha-glucanotransferase
VQLTWMDARVDDRVVTPRIGNPIGVNALWFNALASLSGFARALRSDETRFQLRTTRARQGSRRFTNPRTGSLYDVIDGPGGPDDSIRPNQILAIGLHHSPLDRLAMTRVIRQCHDLLLTSYGLRSLSPADPRYCRAYTGGIASRDGCYHHCVGVAAGVPTLSRRIKHTVMRPARADDLRWLQIT